MEQVMVWAIATDNLVCRNGARYPAVELPKLATFLVGKPASIDHPGSYFSSSGVTDEWGVIQTGEVRRVAPPADLSLEDQAIVSREGYQQVWVAIACAADVDHLAAFEKGLRVRVSIAALYESMRCPGCTCGEDVFSSRCPNEFWSLPYYERCGVVDALEISLVSIPAVRSARVVLNP